MNIQQEKNQPPRWANRLLRWFCAPHLLEEVQGDLQEEFEYRIQRDGIRKARLDYIRNVIGYFKPFAIKRKSSPYANSILSMNMLKHYAIVAGRNLVRHKAFSAINVFGLSLGMTCCLFIFLWVRDEKLVDNFHENGKSLYSLYYHQSDGKGSSDAGHSFPYIFKDNKERVIADEIKQSIPEVEFATPYVTTYELPWGYMRTFQAGEKIHKERCQTCSSTLRMTLSGRAFAMKIVLTLPSALSLKMFRQKAH
jgi:putative ABC transport system permease protein